MSSIELTWSKCEGDVWCPFLNLNLESVGEETEGVYVIWHVGDGVTFARVVRLGKGNIANRIEKHRRNPDITEYAEYGELLVTWAEVHQDLLQTTVEAYLAYVYRPLVGEYPRYSPWMGEFVLPFPADGIPDSVEVS